ncbi:MAG TPA: STAS domain-containing protein [Chloroflexaceae bacterium]|nr:STAS domain-containing protein [Chloroflexaceae bacterium]
MLELILWYLVVAGTGALAAFVATRAWDYRPARLFVLVCAALLLVRLFGDLGDRAATPAAAAAPAALSLAAIALLDLLLLLLFAALFAPAWFEGRRPARWIALPYGLAALLIAADGALGLGVIFAGVEATPTGHSLRPAWPGGLAVLVLFVLSWVPHLAILGLAFARRPFARVSVGLLLGAVVLAQLTGALGWAGALQSVPILLALAYTVLRTRLLLPTRAGITSAVNAMADAVLILDGQGRVTFANPAATAAELHRGEPLDALLRAGDAAGQTTIAGRSLHVRHTAILDDGGRPIGSLLLGRDVTELERRQRLLEEERARLAETIERLGAAQAERAALAETVRQLNLPVIPALPGVLIMPLIGNFDGPRVEQFTQTLLRSIERERARLVLIDITGLPLLDTAGAAGLLTGVRAAALLGARCVLAGVRPEIAQTLVGLGVSFDELATAATLQQALQRELAPPGPRGPRRP